MKVLNERDKKFRNIAMQNLVTGSKKEKEAARRFLLDIGLSDKAVDKIEGKQKVEESVVEEGCGCGKGKKSDTIKCPRCGEKNTTGEKKCLACDTKLTQPMPKDDLREEEIKTGVNSIESAQNMLKAKKIEFNKTEKVGDKTVFKQGDTIVGAWHPSWGTVRTGEDLVGDNSKQPTSTKPTVATNLNA